MPITPTTIMLIKLITDLIISLGLTLQKVDNMTDEEVQLAIEDAEKISSMLQQRQDQH
jgi:hypothetical protein